jgi:hypothetical protein
MCKRYRVVKGSESGHCCFEATVVDTEKEEGVGGYDGQPDLVCECFDLSRAHTIADAMNMADESPLAENTPGPTYQDRCGKEFDVRSALLYFPGGRPDPLLVLPCQSEYDVSTKLWKLCIKTFVDSHQYTVRGTMFEKHPWLLKLEASGEDILTAL